MAEKPHEQNTMKMQSRAGKVANQSVGQSEMYPASFGTFPLKNRSTFPIQEPRKNREIRRFYENRAYQKAKDDRDLF